MIAEALLARMLAEHGLDDRIAISSGGVAAYARDGALASMDARLVLRDEGIHISPETVSTDLKRNRHIVAAADLILAMTAAQLAMLEREFPESHGTPMFTLREFAGSSGDIEDPATKDETFFAACLAEIKHALSAAMPRIADLAQRR